MVDAADKTQLESQSTGRVLVYVVGWLFVVAILAVAQFISIIRVDELDGFLFAHYGRRILDGAALYTQVWDNKPPGIFWINALGLWMGGGSILGVWVLQCAAVAATVALVFAVTRRMYGGGQAMACTILAVTFLYIHNYYVGANRPSTFFVLTEVACFYFYSRSAAGAGRGAGACVFAGACGAIGFAFKQSALAVTAAVVLHSLYLVARRDIEWRVAMWRVASIAIGWLAVAMVTVVALGLTTDVAAAWDAVFAFNGRYFADGAGSSLFPSFVWIEEHLQNMGLALVMAAAALLSPLAALWTRQSADQDVTESATNECRIPRRHVFLLGVWLLIAIYLAAIGPHQRVAYLAIVFPPLVLAMSHSVHLLVASGGGIRSVAPHHVLIGLAWLAYMLIWPLCAQRDMAMRQYYHNFVEDADPGIQQKIDAIERATQPQDPIFIFGYGPDLYWRTNRHSAIRYIGTEKIGQLGRYGQPLLDETTELLQTSPPRLILLDGGTLEKSTSVGQLDTARLAKWLSSNYEVLDPQHFPHAWVPRSTR